MICEQCSAEFQPKNSRHKACSSACAAKRHKEVCTKWKKDNKDKHNSYYRKYYSKNKETLIAKALSIHKSFPEKAKLKSIKAKCKKQNLPFDLDLDWITNSKPALCPVLGIQITGESRELSWELDRLVPSLGYVKTNCRWLSGRANRIKADATLEELERLVSYMKETP